MFLSCPFFSPLAALWIAGDTFQLSDWLFSVGTFQKEARKEEGKKEVDYLGISVICVTMQWKGSLSRSLRSSIHGDMGRLSTCSLLSGATTLLCSSLTYAVSAMTPCCPLTLQEEMPAHPWYSRLTSVLNLVLIFTAFFRFYFYKEQIKTPPAPHTWAYPLEPLSFDSCHICALFYVTLVNERDPLVSPSHHFQAMCSVSGKGREDMQDRSRLSCVASWFPVLL